MSAAGAETVEEIDEPTACQLLTALIRVGRLIDEQPVATLAADDIFDELARLREGIDAAHRAAASTREAGGQVRQACLSNRRQSSRLRLDLDVIHDVPADELLAVLLARVELSLEGDDVDVADVTTSWEPRPIGGGEDKS